MPNLCCIIYIDLCIGAFGVQTTLNDSSLIQFVLYLGQNDGRVADSLVSFILLAFSRIFHNREDGVVLRRTESCCSWSSTAGQPVVHLSVFFTVLTFYVQSWFVIYPFKLSFISSNLQTSSGVFF